MNKMENMEIKQLVVSMSLPIIISMVIQALYNIVDSIFVAKISSDALTAVSLCYPVQTIMIAIACGTAVGFNTLLARYLGDAWNLVRICEWTSLFSFRFTIF